jgi:hypothetical protein
MTTKRMLAVALLVCINKPAMAAPFPDGAQLEKLTGAKGKLDEKEGVFTSSGNRRG